MSLYAHNIHFAGQLIDFNNSPNTIHTVHDIYLEMAAMGFPSGNVLFHGTPIPLNNTLSSIHFNELFFKLNNRLHHQHVNFTTMTASDLNIMALNIRGLQLNVDEQIND